MPTAVAVTPMRTPTGFCITKFLTAAQPVQTPPHTLLKNWATFAHPEQLSAAGTAEVRGTAAATGAARLLSGELMKNLLDEFNDWLRGSFPHSCLMEAAQKSGSHTLHLCDEPLYDACDKCKEKANNP